MIISSDKFFQNTVSNLKTFNSEIDPLLIDAQSKTSGKITGIVVRLGFKLSSNYLSFFPNLKFVATITTGLDHIDLSYCKEKNIQIISLKGETNFLNTITATPEHTWGLLLAIARKIPLATNSVRDGNWQRELFFGSELSGKQIGIVGFGRVGKIISQYANAFRMKVVFADPFVECVDSEYAFAKKVALEELLMTSDFISLHPPLMDTTQHLISEAEFMKMKKKPFLINTSRGKIVCEKNLLQALKNKTIKGAALDVLESELEFVDQKVRGEILSYIQENDNLIVTPHIAGSTFESMQRTALFIEKKISELFPGV